MAKTFLTLPAEQLAPLQRAYSDAIAAKRRQMILGVFVIGLLTVLAADQAEVDLPKLFAKFGNFTSYFDRILTLESGKRVWTDIPEWYWGGWKWLRLIIETLLIAYVATFLGALGAFLLCFSTAQNLTQSAATRFGVKRLLEFCRTVPEIVYALIFVAAFGLGAFAGVLAIAIHTMGALGKQFSEVIENIDMKPVEGAISTGASWSEVIRFAALPQVLSNFVSYALLRFEVNVRGAAVIGFVGAGGIGQDLMLSIRKFYYSDVSAVLLIIIVTVFAIDLITEKLRTRLITAGGPR